MPPLKFFFFFFKDQKCIREDYSYIARSSPLHYLHSSNFKYNINYTPYRINSHPQSRHSLVPKSLRKALTPHIYPAVSTPKFPKLFLPPAFCSPHLHPPPSYTGAWHGALFHVQALAQSCKSAPYYPRLLARDVSPYSCARRLYYFLRALLSVSPSPTDVFIP